MFYRIAIRTQIIYNFGDQIHLQTDMGFDRRKFIREWGVILILVIVKLLIHFFTNSNYEIHRDGLLYIALGGHPAAGYVSVPPSIAIFADISRFLFGDTNFGIRFFPAVIGALSILIIGLIIKTLGGRNLAILVAGIAFLLSPAFLRSNTLLQPVSFNQFYWLLSGFFIIKMIKTQHPKYWLFLGIAWGLAFLNKYSIVFFVLGFFAALLLTRHRRLIPTWQFAAGMILGLLIALPNLLWQYHHSWPIIGHMQELRETQLVNVGIGHFLTMQLLMNAPALLIWLFGLTALLFFRKLKEYRLVGLMIIFITGLLLFLRGKPYYTLGVYPILFAVGGYAMERYLTCKWKPLSYIVIGLTVITALPIIPFSLPVLPMDKMLRYTEYCISVGFTGPMIWEDGEVHKLPQDYADMTGWDELARIVADKYNSLPEEERMECMIYTNNYGEAGAIEYYGDKYGLPEVLCFNESFIFWVPDTVPSSRFIYIGEGDDLNELFNNVEQVGRITDPYARESGLPVYYCYNSTPLLADEWKSTVKEMKDRYSRKIKND